MALEYANDENFTELLGSGLTFVDFWAPWCGPCRMFSPIFEKASEENTDIKFVKFEVNSANYKTSSKYGIRSIPTVLVFKNGELIAARTGLMDSSTFDMWIKELKGI